MLGSDIWSGFKLRIIRSFGDCAGRPLDFAYIGLHDLAFGDGLRDMF